MSIQEVSGEFAYIAENYKEIVNNVENAKAKYRSPEEKIQIMAVTKTVEPEKVNFAVSQGITLLGENRVQEYLSKKDSYSPEARVHMIGHLQTNKVKYIINDVSMIQSVDSFKLATEINRLALKNNKTMDILIEVNVGSEDSKSGVPAAEALSLAEQISLLENVRIRGLMAIPPINCSEALFEKMQTLYDELSSKKLSGMSCDTLSMGMSGDYETAIKYGSNLIRIGTKLFGARKYLEV